MQEEAVEEEGLHEAVEFHAVGDVEEDEEDSAQREGRESSLYGNEIEEAELLLPC